MAIVGSHPMVKSSHNIITRKPFARVVTVMSKFCLRLKNCNNFFSSSPGSQLGKHCHLQSRCKPLKERKAIEMSTGQRCRHHVRAGAASSIPPRQDASQAGFGYPIWMWCNYSDCGPGKWLKGLSFKYHSIVCCRKIEISPVTSLVQNWAIFLWLASSLC